jgi:hypothetical protein
MHFIENPTLSVSYRVVKCRDGRILCTNQSPPISKAPMQAGRDAASRRQDHGEHSDGDTSDADDGAPLALLPTTLSWERLSAQARELMDDAMEHLVDEPGASSPADVLIGTRECAGVLIGTRAPPSSKMTQSKLNAVSVKKIFIAKRQKKGHRSGLSILLGRQYGVTSKAVRDIWNGRTWAKVTEPLWTDAERLRASKYHPAYLPTTIAPAPDLPTTVPSRLPAPSGHLILAPVPHCWHLIGS